MTFDQAEEFLKRITYKPNWIFRIQRSLSIDSVEVGVSFSAHDSAGGINFEGEQPIIGRAYIPEEALKHWDEKDFLDFIHCEIRKLELHEFFEWFRFDGKCVTEPHPEITSSPESK